MNRLQEITASWVVWTRLVPPDVMGSITHVQLNQHEGGYDVHITAWDADQTIVDKLARALGFPTDEGWEPKSGNTKRQWSLDGQRDGLWWHVTVTQDWPAGEGPNEIQHQAEPALVPDTTGSGA